jgi:hypothetical protein
MSVRFLHLSGILFAFFFASLTTAAQVPPVAGSVEVSGRVKIEGKQEKLTRKRFYLLSGTLQQNRQLLDRIRTAEITSRDCYYTRAQASPQFICWLQTENCESPYCRKIETADIERVPEFKAAYQKGLTLFGRKPEIARDWLTTNLSPLLTGGYYKEQETLLGKLLSGMKPLQSSMTDSVTVKAIFVDIPLSLPAGKTSETFTVSNIQPIEFGGKSYVWSCQVDVTADKPGVVRLQVPEAGKTVKNCEVVVKDLAVCKSGDCGQK